MSLPLFQRCSYNFIILKRKDISKLGRTYFGKDQNYIFKYISIFFSAPVSSNVNFFLPKKKKKFLKT